MPNNKAIFLDRDGVLIEERGDYNYREEDINILEGTIEALKALQNKGYLLIVITNQGGVAKKLYSLQRVKEIHHDLKFFYADYGVKITDFYFCPHHPDFSNCLCRKPNSLLLEKAIAKYDIDAKKSYFIGDNQRDIEAGQKVGVQPILIESNASLLNLVTDIE